MTTETHQIDEIRIYWEFGYNRDGGHDGFVADIYRPDPASGVDGQSCECIALDAQNIDDAIEAIIYQLDLDAKETDFGTMYSQHSAIWTRPGY